MKYTTKQAIFDKAYAGLKAQDFRQSIVAGGITCRYRGDDGLKCAVGHLIEDADYRPTLEGQSAARKEVCDVAGVEWSTELVRFTIELQKAHDTGSDPRRMRLNLIELAKTHNLTIEGMKP